jgi:hypothetical protein
MYAPPSYAAPQVSASDLTGKGFWGRFFDFSFKEFITPSFIKVLFVIVLVVIGLSVIFMIVRGVQLPLVSAGVKVFWVIAALVYGFVAVLFSRVFLELIMVFFNVHEYVKKIADKK